MESNKVEFNSFYLEAKKNCLVFFAKSELIKIEKIIPVSTDLEILQTGKIIVNGFLLNEFAQKTNQDVEISVLEKKILVLQTKSYKVDLNLLDLDEFWSSSHFDVAGTNIIFSKQNFHNIINQVSYATQSRDGRLLFQGINLRVSDQHLVATATDGSRIARLALLSFSEKLDVTLHTTTIFEVFRILDSEQIDKVHITFGTEGVFFQIGKGIRLFSKIIGGSEPFPNTENQFVDNFETTVVCNRQELINAVARAEIIFEKNTLPSVLFKVENKQFLVSSPESSELGFFEEKIKTITISGNNQKLSLQAKFVLATLKSLPFDDVVICFSPSDGPVFFAGDKNKKLKALILPIWV